MATARRRRDGREESSSFDLTRRLASNQKISPPGEMFSILDLMIGKNQDFRIEACLMTQSLSPAWVIKIELCELCGFAVEEL
jgi:hypothetical protein